MAAATDITKGKKPKKLTQSNQAKQIIGDAIELIERQLPDLQAAVEKTRGSEKATLTIVIAYVPGSAGTRSRIQLSGKLTTPGGLIANEVVLSEKPGGGGALQLDMFEPGAED